MLQEVSQPIERKPVGRCNEQARSDVQRDERMWKDVVRDTADGNERRCGVEYQSNVLYCSWPACVKISESSKVKFDAPKSAGSRAFHSLFCRFF